MPKKFVVRASKDFLKELGGLPPDIAHDIARRLRVLEVAPLPMGKTGVKKLKGYAPPLYRLRAGDFRVLYRVEGGEVVLLRLVDRKELDRELRRML